MKRAGIRIRTWGRAHVYGTAWWHSPHGPTEEERITHPLDEDEAEALNQLDGAAPGGFAGEWDCLGWPSVSREVRSYAAAGASAGAPAKTRRETLWCNRGFEGTLDD